MNGAAIVFSRFLQVDITTGVIIGMGLVFFYAVLGGMKGITYTQVAQYCVLIFAFMVPAIFFSSMMPDWFSQWETTRLIVFTDKNNDGRIQYGADPATNELEVNRDIMVLANPASIHLPMLHR